MAKEYIAREAVAKKAICMHGFGNVKYVPLSAIMNQPTADVVPRAAYTQCAWERDTAMKQLEEHGIAFGYAAPDVVEVVRCKDCKHWQENPWSKGEMVCRCWADWLPTEPDDFCSYGEREGQQCH